MTFRIRAAHRPHSITPLMRCTPTLCHLTHSGMPTSDLAPQLSLQGSQWRKTRTLQGSLSLWWGLYHASFTLYGASSPQVKSQASWITQHALRGGIHSTLQCGERSHIPLTHFEIRTEVTIIRLHHTVGGKKRHTFNTFWWGQKQVIRW